MIDNKDNKDVFLQIRVARELRERFKSICKAKAINPSELVRQMVTQWCYEQESNSIQHKRTLDI